MTHFTLPQFRRGRTSLGLLLLAWCAVAACNGTTDDGDDNSTTGGGPAAGGEPSNPAAGGGPATGGAPGTGGDPSDGGAGGASCPGRKISDGDPPGAGGAIALLCRDLECEGNCESGHHCNTEVECDDDEQVYCGLNGRNFIGSSNCAPRSYQYEGECLLVNCDLRDVPCNGPGPNDFCAQAREVVSSQLGACIPVPQCACETDEECPDPVSQRCTDEGHCDYR
jgi:hypothetical protein